MPNPAFPNDRGDQQRRSLLNQALAEAEMGPSPEVLADAPHFNRWQPILVGGALCLAGEVRGHPLVPDDDVVTAPLVAIDKNRRWARTVSRFYCLEQSLADALQPEYGHEVIVTRAYGYPALTACATAEWLEDMEERIRRSADQ